MKIVLRVILGVSVLLLAALWWAWPKAGEHMGPGEITKQRLPEAAVDARLRRQLEARYGPGAAALAPPDEKQILFGDLHVHTTYSTDAFFRSLPLMAGEGAHPPADACDFARFCSDLDFWSINDHAEAITPAHWEETVETIRQCDAVAGQGATPDVVPFLGWEWTQVGITRDEHYGHKNVVLREIAPGRVPTRPISARGGLASLVMSRGFSLRARAGIPLLDYANRDRYYDFWRFIEEIQAVPACEEGVDVRELPADCAEGANTPDVLFEKLRQWGFDSLVIPHGNTWGFYTPPGSTWDKQLAGKMHDPDLQTVIEVYSGHGNSEEYRDWREIAWDADGQPVCPEPTADYEPCCWRAGELIRARCGDASADVCEERVATARVAYLTLGAGGHNAVPGASAADWNGCGQCLDCFNPAFNYRPGGSTQYALAISSFDGDPAPRRFQFGFIASSDNHSARPGTGYKEFARRAMTEASGTRDEEWRERFLGSAPPPSPEPFVIDLATLDVQNLPANLNPLRLAEAERQASFFMTGGLVAVHAAGRDRDAIWGALERREIYGTSGERILLWFDLVNGPAGALPMGAEARLGWNPRFRVQAVGSFEQLPGCPETTLSALPPERVAAVCRGECYHPGDARRAITRIEVVRIRPQVRPGEPLRELIEDPWRRFACARDAAGCTVEFEDPDFLAGGRPALYYARAIQEPTPAVNAANLRCRFDESGKCVEVDPCYGDYRTPFDDDCLAPNEERAWSSPIYLDVTAQGDR
jgi:hypothetical protein